MTVNGKCGIRVTEFLSCFLSNNFKSVRLEYKKAKDDHGTGAGGGDIVDFFYFIFYSFF